MFKKLNDRLSAARTQDEMTRLSIASRWIIITGILIILVWLLIILPLQIYLIQKFKNNSVNQSDTVELPVEEQPAQ